MKPFWIPGYHGCRRILIDFGIWEGHRSIGNGFRIDLGGFAARKIEYGSILRDLNDFAFLGSSPAGPTWVFTQVDRTLGFWPAHVGFGRTKPKSTWVLAGQIPSQLGSKPKSALPDCSQKVQNHKNPSTGTIFDFSG